MTHTQTRERHEQLVEHVARDAGVALGWAGPFIRWAEGLDPILDLKGLRTPEPVRLALVLLARQRPPQATRVLVELDVDHIKDQIRDAVVELVDERDRARDTAALLEQRLAETRRLLDEALDFGHGAMTLEEIRVELAGIDDVVSACSCPAVVDGHVCEPS